MVACCQVRRFDVGVQSLDVASRTVSCSINSNVLYASQQAPVNLLASVITPQHLIQTHQQQQQLVTAMKSSSADIIAADSHRECSIAVFLGNNNNKLL